MKTFQITLVLAVAANAQQSGTQQSETHPSLTLQTCDASSCTSATKKVTIDSNWRWTDEAGTNCYTGNAWDTSICTDADTCAEVCAVEGADYESTYGIHSSGSELKLDFVTEGSYGNNVGSRTYMLNTDNSYEMFYLKNHEFTFDVDVSQLPCGLNGALYFVAMDEDGGLSANENNNAGAKYGTGYCDAQCPRDLKYIDGKANVENWVPSEKDVNSGTGDLGSCCFEMDIWEANKVAQAVTPHTCDVIGQTMCTGDEECGDIDSGDRYTGLCDKDGCDFATYRLGNTTFYGEGSDFTLDTTSPLTVVTQFITEDGTDSGDLVEIRRVYVQNGVVIENPTVNIGGNMYDSITDDFCTDQKTLFGDDMGFLNKGGLQSMGEQMEEGMVLVMSLWDDYSYNMWWLDSTYPTDADPTTPGVARGSCSTDSGEPSDVESESPDAYVTYSNIKYGTIGSTYGSSSSPVVN